MTERHLPGRVRPVDSEIAELRRRIYDLERQLGNAPFLSLRELVDVNAPTPDDQMVLTYVLSEAEWQPLPTGASGVLGLVFSFPGFLVPTNISPPWYLQGSTPFTFTNARYSVRASGGSGSHVDLILNGSTTTSLTLSGASVTGTAAISIAMNPGDYLNAEVVSDSGSQDASIELS